MPALTRQQRNEQMLNAPIGRIIPRLAVPTIISMLITTLYNMADTYFVSGLGTDATAAVGIVYPVMTVLQAIAFTIGMGSGANLSRCLGAGNEELGKRFVSMGFFTGLGVGALVGLTGLTCLDDLLGLLGTPPEVMAGARQYASYILMAAPFVMCSFVMNNFLRFQGLAFYGMIGMSTGGVLNMVLDPILIFHCGMGVTGAALATAISQAVSFCLLLIMTNRGGKAIAISPRNFRPTAKMYLQMINNGLPSLGRQGIASVSGILLNRTAGLYGTAAIAAMAIVGRCVMFVNSTVIGFGQGFQPVCGFCFGAGRYERVKEAFWFCVKVATVILLVMGMSVFLLATPLVQAFTADPAVLDVGVRALRRQLLTIPLWGFIVMSNMFTQSIGYGLRATVISVARQGLFLIPLLVLFSGLWGLDGLLMAQPAADLATFALALVIVMQVLRGFAGKEKLQPDA